MDHVGGEGGAGVGLAASGDVFVADEVVEVVAFEEEEGEGFEGGDLGLGVVFPFALGSAVFVVGDDGGQLGPVAGEFPVVASVGEFDADGAGVEAVVEDAGFGVFPFAVFSSVAGGAVEGSALVDGAVSVDDDVGACAFGFGIAPPVDAGLGGGSGGEVDDEEAADGHGGAAGDGAVDDFGAGEDVEWGDCHWGRG